MNKEKAALVKTRNSRTKSKTKTSKTLPKIVQAAIIVVCIGLAVFYISSRFSLSDTGSTLHQDIYQQLSEEDAALLRKLAALMILPSDIEPTMAVIDDINLLKQTQPEFFKDAKNGDRLIIYPDMAIIFDAAANKIVKIGPVIFPEPGNNATQPVTFAIYNGTGAAGQAAAMETTLTSVFQNAVVTVKDNAVGEYPETLVVDLVGNYPGIDLIADQIGGTVAPLPEGEIKPEGATVLVIVGTDNIEE